MASEAEGTIDGRKAGLGPVVEVTALPSRKPPGGAVGTGGGGIYWASRVCSPESYRHFQRCMRFYVCLVINGMSFYKRWPLPPGVFPSRSFKIYMF